MSPAVILGGLVCLIAVGVIGHVTHALFDIEDFEPAEVFDPEYPSRPDEEQRSRDVHPQLLGRLSVGGEISHIHPIGDTDAAA